MRLRNGRALVDLAIDREKLPERRPAQRHDACVIAAAHAAAGHDDRHRAGQRERAAARRRHACSASRARRRASTSTRSSSALDTDTRAWVMTLRPGDGRGVKDRGPALRAIFKAASPTLEVHAPGQRERSRRAGASCRGPSTTSACSPRRSAARTASLGRARRAAATPTFARSPPSRTRCARRSTKLPATLARGADALDALTPLAREAGPAFTAPAADGAGAAERAARLAIRCSATARRRCASSADVASAPRRSCATCGRRWRTSEGHARPRRPPSRCCAASINELAYVPTTARTRATCSGWPGSPHNLNAFTGGQDANGPFWRGNAIAVLLGSINLPDNPLS